MKWQDAEAEVRRIAESVWAANAAPKTEAGIRCDVVLKYRPDYWIIIEVSKRNDLAKLREDITKLSSIRLGLIAKQIFCEAYFVTIDEESSLVETGSHNNVGVFSLSSFATKFIGARQYINERSAAPFGSAVDPDTGGIDQRAYTPILYVDNNGHRLRDPDIVDLLQAQKKVVLVGEFGTGKSRCLMQVFSKLAQPERAFVPIAINLRDNWGYTRFSHIIANHLDGLGLGQFRDTLVRSLRRGNHVLLLDGFDEIGSQSWSGDPARLRETRRKSLEGVRDLIASCPNAGILLTGREHYFSSDEEMADCLGVTLDHLIILRCPDEFSENEAKDYVKNNTHLAELPDWMPRKPLICQLLARLSKDEIDHLAHSASGEIEFFERIFDSICARETRINAAIDKETLRSILLMLAQYTRTKPPSGEAVSVVEINKVFYDVTRYAPIDESAVMLQRLPYLGRVGSGSSDRLFIDPYAKDGLRGIALANSFVIADRMVAQAKWIQPPNDFGIRVLGGRLSAVPKAENFVRLCINHGNQQVACDYVALLTSQRGSVCDFRDMSITDGKIAELEFSEATFKNLQLSGVEIGSVTIESAVFENVRISDCTIDSIKGIGGFDKLPSIFDSVAVGSFDDALNISRISELRITNAQKTLLALVKKLFFQPGSGRQEEALLRGTENYWERDAAQKILSYMQRHQIIERVRGDHGIVFVPMRRQTRRMARIWELQSSCGDELWLMLDER